MEARELFGIRVRHALRIAVGGAAITALGLTTSATSGCLTSVLFLVSTIAGTPENYQAFQLRTTSLTFLGACLGACAYAIVHVIAGTSRIGSFFAAVPFITLFASLRPDSSLTPLPPVANVVLGLLTISRSGESRSTIARTLGFSLADVAIAYLTAVLINLPFPDRASDLGRRMIATEVRQLGAHISQVASRTFSTSSNDPKSNTHTSFFIEEGFEEHAKAAGLLDDDYIFQTGPVARSSSPTTVGLERNPSMIKSAHQSLLFLQQLRPFGRTRVDDYTNLARAEQLLSVSKYEPRILPSSKALWRNATTWAQLIEALTALVTKVSSLESVSYRGKGGPSRFSQNSLLELLGEAYEPLWISHFASCATACAAMSSAICHATCKDMFYLAGEGRHGVRGSCPLEATIDPRKWKSRRADMYFGFLLRYRSRIRSTGRGLSHSSSVSKLTTLGLDDMRSLDIDDDVQDKENGGTKPSVQKGSGKRLEKNSNRNMGELQALSLFGVASHSLSEEIAHVQRAMVELAASSEERTFLSPLAFLTAGMSDLARRSKRLLKGDVKSWEVRFTVSHSLLLITILALSLFLPLTFEAAEIAWVFTSAALAAQLSAEPTLFIGLIRICATTSGAALAFGFTAILDSADRASHPGLQYLMIPYMCLVTVTFLLILPPTFRYAAFLIIVTNAVLLFCPRSIPECIGVLHNQSEECFPNWQYAVSRAVNVSIGVVFALFFHMTFWPRFASQEAFRSLSTSFINAARLLGKIRRTYFSYGLVRSEWLRQDVELSSDSNGENETLAEISDREGDFYRKDMGMIGSLREELSAHVSKATLTVKAEAGLWRSGPLRLSPLLPELLSEFIALDVSLSELAALLGRRPIFSESYGRSAHEHFIDPMLPYYETIQVSLNNMAGIVHRIFGDQRNRSLRQNSLDLYQSIAHLARMRSELRSEAEKRAEELEHKDFGTLQVRKRLSSWSRMEELDQKVSFESDREKSDDVAEVRRQPRRQSTNDLARVKRQVNEISVDDIVLYNTFSFIADGCLSAFVRIAVAVLTDAEAKLKIAKGKTKEKAE